MTQITATDQNSVCLSVCLCPIFFPNINLVHITAVPILKLTDQGQQHWRSQCIPCGPRYEGWHTVVLLLHCQTVLAVFLMELLRSSRIQSKVIIARFCIFQIFRTIELSWTTHPRLAASSVRPHFLLQNCFWPNISNRFLFFPVEQKQYLRSCIQTI